MNWLEIDDASGEVIGWVRSPKAVALPAAPAGRTFVEAAEADIEQYETMSRTLRAQRRSARVKWVSGALTLPADARQRVRVVADKASVRADGTDMVTLTISALRADGTVRTGLNRSVQFETLGGRVLQLDFVSGVATKTIPMPASGRFRIQSNDAIDVEAEVEITAVE